MFACPAFLPKNALAVPVVLPAPAPIPANRLFTPALDKTRLPARLNCVAASSMPALPVPSMLKFANACGAVALRIYDPPRSGTSAAVNGAAVQLPPALLRKLPFAPGELNPVPPCAAGTTPSEIVCVVVALVTINGYSTATLVTPSPPLEWRS